MQTSLQLDGSPQTPDLLYNNVYTACLPARPQQYDSHEYAQYDYNGNYNNCLMTKNLMNTI